MEFSEVVRGWRGLSRALASCTSQAFTPAEPGPLPSSLTMVEGASWAANLLPEEQMS